LSCFSLTSLNILKITRCYKSTRDKSSIPTDLTILKRENKLEDKAINLICGNKQYSDFTPKEKFIVDLFQDNILKEGLMILPNTRVWMEQLEYIEMLKKEILKFYCLVFKLSLSYSDNHDDHLTTMMLNFPSPV